MADKQIFFDPQRKRWKRLRRVLDVVAVLSTLVGAGFSFNVFRSQPRPELPPPTPKHNYKALPDLSLRAIRPARRKSNRKPSEIPFNSGEGLRAAYYIPDDPASYSSFKEHVHQIDFLFPQWFHATSPSGTLMATNGDTHHEYPVVDGATVHDPDEGDKVKHVIQEAREDTEVFPHLNNYNAPAGEWDSKIGNLLKDGAGRAVLRQQLGRFVTAYPVYHRLSLDFESLGEDADPAY